jgi:hypothetical protein
VDTVEGVDGDAIGLRVEIVWASLAELENSMANRRVQEADANGCDMSLAIRLNGGCILRDLDEPLEGLEEAAKQHACREAASAHEYFDNAWGGLDQPVSYPSTNTEEER